MHVKHVIFTIFAELYTNLRSSERELCLQSSVCDANDHFINLGCYKKTNEKM